VLMKATKVDGVYTADPVLDPTARLMTRLSYSEVLKRELRVMDAAAISLCKETAIPVLIFNIHKPGILQRVVMGEEVGSLIGPEEAV
jgi:uridylate kinase